MAYTIRYGTSAFESKSHTKRKRRWLFVCFGIILCCLFALDDNLRLCLLPGDPAVTAAALDTLQGNLRAGQTLRDAFTAFCLEIIHGAALPF